MTMISAHKTWLPAFATLQSGRSYAAPIEGEAASNAAAILVVLGVLALLMGVRNLRDLRHKRLTPDRPSTDRDEHEL